MYLYIYSRTGLWNFNKLPFCNQYMFAIWHKKIKHSFIYIFKTYVWFHNHEVHVVYIWYLDQILH